MVAHTYNVHLTPHNPPSPPKNEHRTVLLAYLTAVQYAGFTVMPMAGGLLSDIFEVCK